LRYAAEVNIGDVFPAFDLPDHQDRRWSLQTALGEGPQVFVFYRGDW